MVLTVPSNLIFPGAAGAITSLLGALGANEITELVVFGTGAAYLSAVSVFTKYTLFLLISSPSTAFILVVNGMSSPFLP